MPECDGKKAYHSAKKAGRVATARSENGAGYLRVYHCPRCGSYHLTSKPPSGEYVPPADDSPLAEGDRVRICEWAPVDQDKWRGETGVYMGRTRKTKRLRIRLDSYGSEAVVADDDVTKLSTANAN